MTTRASDAGTLRSDPADRQRHPALSHSATYAEALAVRLVQVKLRGDLARTRPRGLGKRVDLVPLCEPPCAAYNDACCNPGRSDSTAPRIPPWPAPHRPRMRRNLAAGVFAVFTAGAGIAQGLGALIWLKLAFGAVAVIGAVVALFLLLKERSARATEQQSEQAEAERVRSAVGLDVSHDGDDGYLWVTNRGLHVVHDIEIGAIPDDEDWMPTTHGALPRIYEDTGPGVTLTAPIVGGWFYAEVTRLSPGRGTCVAHYHDGGNDYQQIDIDVKWNDHEGRQRKAHVTADLRECIGALTMTPRSLPR